MTRILDISGQRFGRLIARERLPLNNGKCKWRCDCDCGGVAEVQLSNLRRGKQRSCGCLKLELQTKHNLSRHKAYDSWQKMMKRCYNPRNQAYPRYGGRGICVCQRWHDVTCFIADMGTPQPGMMIERINNDGNYEPSNCKWATREEQARNTSYVKKIEFHGEVLCVAEWARKLDVSVQKIRYRLKRGRD